MLGCMSRVLHIQGRQLSPDDIETIRRLMAENPDWHRTRLSKEICQRWDWRTNKGLLKDMACRTMLRKLEQQNLIVLPEKRSSGNRARRIRDIYHSSNPIQASLHDLLPVRIFMIEKRGTLDDLFHCLMDRYHYLGCHGHVGEHIKYIILDRLNRPLACLLFGAAAWKTAARDEFIGWDAGCRQKNLQLITNNTRFLILPWVKVKNLASHILGICLKRLRNDWNRRYGHDLFLVETFVDQSRFVGTCYKAANWTRIGKTKGRGRQDRYGKFSVTLKDLYVYPLISDFKQRLCSTV